MRERTIDDKGRQYGAPRLVDMDDARRQARVGGEPLDLERAAPVGSILAFRCDLERERLAGGLDAVDTGARWSSRSMMGFTPLSTVAPPASEEEGAIFERSERDRHRADLVRVAVRADRHGFRELPQAQAILLRRRSQFQG
jgi:hypothetical protein